MSDHIERRIREAVRELPIMDLGSTTGIQAMTRIVREITAEAEAKVAALTTWRPMATAPEAGTFLVLLEMERGGSRVHSMCRHGELSLIGTSFAFDMPKPLGWMPLPPIPDKIEGKTP